LIKESGLSVVPEVDELKTKKHKAKKIAEINQTQISQEFSCNSEEEKMRD